MDVARPSNAGVKRRRRVLIGAALVLGTAAITFGFSRLKPAAVVVQRSAVLVDTVTRGAMVRDVRGVGTLVPEDVRWIPATTEGRVERVVLRAGVPVTPNSVVLELSNPQLEQQFEDASLHVTAAQAQLESLTVQLQNDFLAQRAAAANIGAEYAKAKMLAEMNEALAKKNLVSALTLQQSRVDADQLHERDSIAREQLASYQSSITARLAVQRAELAQAQAALGLRTRQRNELIVRAGLTGVLQVVTVEEGQQVAPGANLARVANPTRLKAEIRIAETEAKDLQIGQKAVIDTRNGVVVGILKRIDPAVQNGTRTVDVTLTGELPKGAVPDLSVDGTIELERLADVLTVGRPAFGQEQQDGALFRIAPDGTAARTTVKFGHRSADRIEVVSGLSAGDQVVLSDMSGWDRFDRIRIQ